MRPSISQLQDIVPGVLGNPGPGNTAPSVLSFEDLKDFLGSSGQKIYTPFDFNAIDDPLADNTIPIQNALSSGEYIHGLNRRYSFTEQVNPTALGTFVCAEVGWLNESEMRQQNRSLIHVNGLSGWTMDSVDFDLGTVEDLGVGSENDNGRNGLTVNTQGGQGDGPSGWCNRVKILNCEGFGKGNGTPFNLRNLKSSRVEGCLVHDRSMIMGDPGVSDNDSMNGFTLSFCDDLLFTSNRVYQNQVSADGGATYTYDYNRGVTISGLQNSIISNNHMRLVGQGFDFSGNLSVNGGNRGLNIFGNTGAYCFSWAFKFVHGIKDCSITSCFARFTGRNGFVFNSDDYSNVNDHTQRLYFSNCHAIQGWAPPYATNNYSSPPTGAWSNTWRGFRIIANNPANGARNLRFNDCSAYDNQSFMDYGWWSDNTSDKTSNIMRNCDVYGAQQGNYNSNIAAAAWRTL